MVVRMVFPYWTGVGVTPPRLCFCSLFVAVAVGPSSRDACWHLKASAHMFSCAEPAQLAANQEEQMMEVGEEEREEQEEQEAAPCDLTVDGGRCHCGHCDF